MSKKLVSWDDVALALPAVVWTKLLATFDALGAAAAITPASIGAATPASVTAAVTALVNAAPGTMDTLGEIATIIASDESAAAALLTSVAAKATTAALTAETSRATTAEAANATNIAANTTAVAAEATTARNASNLTSGTVPDSRLPTTAQAATLSATYAPRYLDSINLNAPPYNLNPGDDATAALQAAMDQVQATLRSTDIYFAKPGTYTLNGPQQTGTVLGWAYSGQVLLPPIPSGYGVAVRMRGSGCPPYFGQYNYTNSTKLVSNATTGYIFDTVPEHAAWAGSVAPWSELMPVFEDIAIEGPAQPSGGINTFCCEAALFNRVTINGSLGAGDIPGPSLPAIVFPQVNNSGNVSARDVHVRNWGTGVFLTEHTVLDQVRIVFSDTAFTWGKGGNSGGHLNTFTYVNVEQCKNVFKAVAGSQLAPEVGTLYVNGALDLEVVTNPVVAFVDQPTQGSISGSLEIICPAVGGWPLLNGSTVLPHLGPLNLRNLNQKGVGTGTEQKAAGQGWMDSHPSDNFLRVKHPQVGGLGLSWPTLHPWALRNGSFTIAEQGSVTAPAATAGATALALIPAQQRSRTGILTFTAPATGTWDVRLHMHFLQGTNQGKSIEAVAASDYNGRVGICVNHSGSDNYRLWVDNLPAIAAGGQHVLAMRVIQGFDGIPRSADLYLDGVQKGSASLTPTDKANLIAGGNNYPSISDGVELRDGATVINAFQVIDANPDSAAKTSTQMGAATTLSTGIAAAIRLDTATTVQTIDSDLGAGEIITFKADGTTINFATGGNIALTTGSTLAVLANHTVSFAHFTADGADAQWRQIAST